MKKILFILFLIFLQTIDCKSTAHKKKSPKHQSHDQGESSPDKGESDPEQTTTEASKEDTCGLRRIDSKNKNKKKVSGAGGLGRVVGGVDAEPSEFPWHVSLQIYIPKRKKIDHFCGAAIIKEQWVLTAAHCVEVLFGKEKQILIKPGSNQMKDYKTPNYTVDHFVIHEGWNKKTQANDIALIKSKEKIHFKTNKKKQYEVNSVCLPEKDSEVKGKLTLTGFGQTGEDAEQAENLQKLDVPVYDHDKCVENYKEYIKIDDLKICAGGKGGQDSCMGDSGGPLVQNTGERVKIVGVVSFGLPCAVKNMPGVYTKISSYIDWINEHVEGST